MAAVIRTDIGLVRAQNEDSGWLDETKGIYAVADGMGGHLAGEVASAMAIDALKKMTEENDRPGIGVLRRTIDAANNAILTHAKAHEECSGMGTTLSVLWRRDDRAYIGHVGDSRIYRLREGRLDQITRDHSLVEEMVRAGILSKEDARLHPRRNIITRALGTEGDNYPDMMVEQIAPQDFWLLCSDGLTGMVEDEAIRQVLEQDASLEEKADRLLAMALEAGGRDNVTLILMSGEDLTWNQD